MKPATRSALIALAAALLAAEARAGLPEGSFQGTSPLLKGPNVMAFLVRQDPKNPAAYYAVLAEYDRKLPIPNPGPERVQITKWVPRIYALRLESVGKLKYAVKPLRVSAAGEIETDPGYPVAGELTLAKDGKMDGAVLKRYNKGSAFVDETVAFKGKISSTWEKFVPGDYFFSKDSTGGDYFHKNVNATLGKDQVADYNTPVVIGRFAMEEKAPGMFVSRAVEPLAPNAKGREKVEPTIGVFIDIVNWKPFFTTDELLLINPDDAADVGFFYERH